MYVYVQPLVFLEEMAKFMALFESNLDSSNPCTVYSFKKCTLSNIGKKTWYPPIFALVDYAAQQSI
jgi:hypothetical protein